MDMTIRGFPVARNGKGRPKAPQAGSGEAGTVGPDDQTE
jgi:hypothetical protein